jgi:hypothetical protein
MPTTSIQVAVDAYSSPLEPAMIHNYIASKYVFPVTGIPTTVNKFKEFCAVLKSKYDYEEAIFDINASNKTYVIEYQDEFMMNAYIDSLDTMEITIYANSAKKAEEIYNMLKPYQEHTTEADIIIDSYYVADNGKLETSTSSKTEEAFRDVSKLYYPFLDTDEMFKQYFLSKESLMLLSGETGTGKTKIIDLTMKYLLDNIDGLDTKVDDEGRKYVQVAYVKNAEILGKDAFWTRIGKIGYDLIVLDDTDFMLISREHNDKSYSDDVRNKFITQFLSFTDGINKSNTKFIITTNQHSDSIDTAILRKGRCFDILKFRELTKEEAFAIWLERKLDESIFEEYFGSQRLVKQCDVGSKIDLHSNMNSKNISELSSYVKEDGISVYNRGHDKKISF